MAEGISDVRLRSDAQSLTVCFFNRSYYPDVSATGQLLTELAEGLVRDYKCKVTVVAGPPLHDSRVGRSRRHQRESWNGVEILRASGTALPHRRFVGRATNYVSYFVSACIVARRIPRQDVVIALTDPPIIGLAALMTANRWGARFVFLCQDVFPEVAALLEDFKSGIVNRTLDRITRVLIRKSDRIVALGETMRDRLAAEKGADPRKIKIIHNWADCSLIVPGQKSNPFSSDHGLAERFVVMHSGNMGLSQDLDSLLSAAKLLRPYPDVVVVIIGDGAKRVTLEARAHAEGISNVRFLPYQPKEQLSQAFATADVFIVSLKRGLAGYIVPSKLYGILAAGRPYVAAVEEACEVTQITRKYDCGLLAEPNHPEELAERIVTLYRDRDLARRLGENARCAALDFDRPRQMQAYYELLHELGKGASLFKRARHPLLKGLFDVALSTFGLFASAPLWVLIGLSIKLDDGGPVFYSQYRVGKDGRRFRSWKFRSMVADSDKRFGPLQAREGDARITRVGRILRATAMDELPQLWNILRGDLSFVGPRALVPEEIEVNGDEQILPLEKIPGYEVRHRIRPGLTGVAQIYAARDLPRRHKFKFDLLYIEKRSFWLDVRLIALSIWITFRGRWEARGGKL